MPIPSYSIIVIARATENSQLTHRHHGGSATNPLSAVTPRGAKHTPMEMKTAEMLDTQRILCRDPFKMISKEENEGLNISL